jgi:fatty-acyl-CoA synthase
LSHPSIQEAAVVGVPDEKWGEVPCAYVTLHPHITDMPEEKDLVIWARARMAHFQAPKKIVVLDVMPKTSTGKTQKHILRNKK